MNVNEAWFRSCFASSFTFHYLWFVKAFSAKGVDSVFLSIIVNELCQSKQCYFVLIYFAFCSGTICITERIQIQINNVKVTVTLTVIYALSGLSGSSDVVRWIWK